MRGNVTELLVLDEVSQSYFIFDSAIKSLHNASMRLLSEVESRINTEWNRNSVRVEESWKVGYIPESFFCRFSHLLEIKSSVSLLLVIGSPNRGQTAQAKHGKRELMFLYIQRTIILGEIGWLCPEASIESILL